MSYDTAPTIAETQAPVEPSIQENANMIQGLFSKIVSKAIEGTDLATRVAELERQLSEAKAAIETLQRDLRLEREAHAETVHQLTNVQTTLGRRESAIQDLVQERDIVVSERDNLCNRVTAHIAERDSWAAIACDMERERDDERQRNHVLEERCNAMQQRINALKDAFSGLASL